MDDLFQGDWRKMAEEVAAGSDAYPAPATRMLLKRALEEIAAVRREALAEAAQLAREVCEECAEGWHDGSATGWRGHVRAAGQCVESRILILKDETT